MNFKIFSFIVLSMFLLSMASAMTVYADFSDSSQSLTITQGNSVSFNADFFSMNPPMTMKVQIIPPQGDTITKLNTNTNSKTYSNTYSYTPSASGTYEIRVIGTDKINTDSEYLTLVVNSVQPPTDTTPPVITILGSNPVTMTQGNNYNDAGAIAIDNVDGDITSSIQMTNNVNTNVAGTYFVDYNVQDSSGNSAITKTRTVYVASSNPTNHAPEITSNPVTSVTEGNYYVYDVEIDYDGNEELTYNLIDAPGWLTININTGKISGTAPLVSSSTDYQIEVEVSDSNGGFDTQSYTLRVKNFVSGSGGGGRVISDSDIYYQNKYFDQFNPEVVYSKPVTQKILGLDVLTFFYILIFLISIGIVIVVFLLGRNLRR